MWKERGKDWQCIGTNENRCYRRRRAVLPRVLAFLRSGQVTPLAGFCDEIQHLFVGHDLTLSNGRECDEDEVIEVVTFSLAELEQKIIEGEITDTKTIACLGKAKLCGLI